MCEGAGFQGDTKYLLVVELWVHHMVLWTHHIWSYFMHAPVVYTFARGVAMLSGVCLLAAEMHVC